MKRGSVAADQVGLGPRLDVAGKQCAARGITDPKHTGQVVRLELRIDVVRLDRVQQREIHSVPLPALAGNTALRGLAAFDARTDDGMLEGQRRREPHHRHGMQERQRAAAVIAVLVADDHRVEPRHPAAAQHRGNDAIAGIGALVEARARIVEERVRARLHQHRETLPHVEHGDPECAGRRKQRDDHEERRQPCQSERAARQPARKGDLAG